MIADLQWLTIEDHHPRGRVVHFTAEYPVRIVEQGDSITIETNKGDGWAAAAIATTLHEAFVFSAAMVALGGFENDTDL